MTDAEPQRIFLDRLGEPLQNPLRRRIVRALNRRPEERGATEVALETGEKLALVSYHLRSLVAAGVVGQRGEVGPEARYTSAVIGLPKILALLEMTRAEDEARRAA